MSAITPVAAAINSSESPAVVAAEARAVAPLQVSSIEAVARSRLLTVAADSLLVEVAALLSSAQISVVVVCDAAGAPLGVITETVLVRRLGLGQADFFTTGAGEVMAREFVACAPEDLLSDVLAMMLPVYVLPQQAGLAAYPSPPVLLNHTNRGQTLASRSVRNTYVAEQAGDYLLPASEYYWWNTQSAELELLSLPATHITVAGAVARSSEFGSASSSRLAVVAGGLLLVVVILRLAWVCLPQLPLAKNTARLFQWLSHRVSHCLCRLRAWRKPALAKRLNPGSSAED